MRRPVFATTCLLQLFLFSWRPLSGQGTPQARPLPINGGLALLHQAIPDASLRVIPQGEHVPILGARAPLFLEMASAFLRVERLQQRAGR